MEEPERFVLKDTAAMHILRHFEEIESELIACFITLGFSETRIRHQLSEPGSKFFASFCKNPYVLIEMLNLQSPHKMMMQRNGTKALLYRFDSGFIGTDSLVELSALSPDEKRDMKNEIRDGQMVHVIERKHLEPTDECVVIVNDSTKQVVTAFPGRYAPPLPGSHMQDDMASESSVFWKSHVFVRKVG